MDGSTRPVTVAVANDYELVIAGVQAMLQDFTDRVTVADAILVGQPVARPVDVALFDTYGRPDDVASGVKRLLDTENITTVAVYQSTPRPTQTTAALEAGASAVISKARPAAALVDALHQVRAGERVIDGATGHQPTKWPGSGRGLTARQSEVVALLLQGLSNAEIAKALFVDVNTIKTHLRHAYKALGVRSRSQALAMLLGEDPSFRRASPAQT